MSRSCLGAALATVFVLLFGDAASAQALLSPNAFRDQVVAAIHHENPAFTVTATGPLILAVDQPDGTDQSISLDNLYHSYEAAPDDLATLVDRMARVVVGRVEVPHDADALVIILRPREYLDHLASLGGRPISRPLAGDLFELLAFDSPEALHVVMSETLRETQMNADEAWIRAAQNLPHHMGAFQSSTAEGCPGVVIVREPNGLAPSHLIEDNFCLSEQTHSLYVVVDRDAYAVAHKSDHRAETSLRGLARSGALMSSTLLECLDARLVTAD